MSTDWFQIFFKGLYFGRGFGRRSAGHAEGCANSLIGREIICLLFVQCFADNCSIFRRIWANLNVIKIIWKIVRNPSKLQFTFHLLFLQIPTYISIYF